MTETPTTPATTPEPAQLMPSATGYRLPASTLAADIREQLHRANWPEQNEMLVDVASDRAAHEVRAGTPLPLDPHESKGAGYLLDDLAAARERVGSLRTLRGDALDRVDDARKALAGLTLPLPPPTLRSLIATIVVLTVIGVFALKALLSSSFDELLFRPYFEGLDVNDAARESAAQAERLVLYAASLLLGAKAAAVIGSNGQLSTRAKALLFIVAGVFSACLAIVRLTPGFSWAAVAVSGIELALLLSFSLALIAVSGVLRRDAEQRTAYQTAEATLAAAQERATRFTTELAAAENAYEAKRSAVAQREDDVRRLPLTEAVARSTVRSEALVTTLELMSTAAQGTQPVSPIVSTPTAGDTP